MKVRNKQVYVAADGSEHDTLDDAVRKDVANFLMQQVRHVADDAGMVVNQIMKQWSTLVTIMDQLGAQVVQVEEPSTPQERLAARRERVAKQDRQPHTGKCTCERPGRMGTSFDLSTGCQHCLECGGIMGKDADFEAENDANEAPRRGRSSKVQEHQRDSATGHCDSCGHNYVHMKHCAYRDDA